MSVIYVTQKLDMVLVPYNYYVVIAVMLNKISSWVFILSFFSNSYGKDSMVTNVYMGKIVWSQPFVIVVVVVVVAAVLLLLLLSPVLSLRLLLLPFFFFLCHPV